jgi:hypothetical protein
VGEDDAFPPFPEDDAGEPRPIGSAKPECFPSLGAGQTWLGIRKMRGRAADIREATG